MYNNEGRQLLAEGNYVEAKKKILQTVETCLNDSFGNIQIYKHNMDFSCKEVLVLLYFFIIFKTYLVFGSKNFNYLQL